MEIRGAVEEDESWMFALYRRVFQAHIEGIWGWDDDWQIADFERGVRECDCRVIELDSERIGFIRSLGSQDLELQLLALRPEHQGRGLGTAVVKKLKHSCRRIDLRVFITNDPARRFYSKIGFTDKGGDSEFYSMTWCLGQS